MDLKENCIDTARYEEYMHLAIGEALKCEESDDVPVGALIVFNNEIIGRGYNTREKFNSAIWHAEMAAVREANERLGVWNLTGSTLIVTKEPCVMCAGLIVQSRISKVVFGAYDKKGGGCGGSLQIAANEKLNHRAEIIGGILENECVSLLKKFFKKKRK
ncbi:MAG: nucleoside deaminase [Candidatus Wallbacteria bacterium]